VNRPVLDSPIESGADTLEGPSSEAVPAPQPVALRELGGRLNGLSLPQQVWVLAAWPFLEHLLNFMVGMVDTTLAGRLSVEATNAVSVASYVAWFMRLMQMAVAIGSTALIARAIGGRHKRLANAAVGQSIVLAIIVGLVSTVLVFATAVPVGQFTRLEGENLRLAVIYLNYMAVGALASSILAVSTAVMKGAGDTKTPFWIMVVVNVVNTIVSMTMVWGPEPIGGWGVAGLAIGTVVAWTVGALVCLHVLLRGYGGVKLHLPRLRPHWHTIRRIVRVGMPNFFEALGMWSGNMLVLAVVGRLGAEGALAAWGAHMIAIRVEAVSFMPGFAVGTAAATLTGQYLGLGDPDRARRAAKLCWFYGAAVMAVLGIVFITIPEPLVRIVTNKPELLAAAPPLVRIIGPVQVFLGTYMILAQALRGAGDTRSTMFITYASVFLIRLPAAYALGILLGWGLNGVWIAMASELVIRGCLFAGRFLHGGWTKAQV